MGKKLRLSIIMPVYNGQAFLLQALQSVQAQDLRDWELIAVDDGSSDASLSMLRAAAASDRRIRVLVNTSNQGIARSLNRLIRAARCDLIVRMDADDVCLPGRLRAQLSFMDAHPRVGVLGGACVEMDRGGRELGVRRLPLTDAELKKTLYFHAPFIHPTVAARRHLLLSVGGYNGALDIAEDYDLWARLAPKTEFANLPQPLLRYRRHESNASLLKLDRAIELHYEIGAWLEKQYPIPWHWRLRKRLLWFYHHLIGKTRIRQRWERPVA